MLNTSARAPLKSGSLKKGLLTCGGTLALLTAAMAGHAMAQTAPTDTTAGAADGDKAIVVTGIRKGIQDAITAKRKSSSIIEAVSAEDIGKLPDNSIAESIARLPGVAAQRTNGRAQTLSIRGLGPDYTVTTFNGREQASTNDNRTVEYDQYPSELVSQVKVFKTPDASMSYQGIAGTADIETVHPGLIAVNDPHQISRSYANDQIKLNYHRLWTEAGGYHQDGYYHLPREMVSKSLDEVSQSHRSRTRRKREAKAVVRRQIERRLADLFSVREVAAPAPARHVIRRELVAA